MSIRIAIPFLAAAALLAAGAAHASSGAWQETGIATWYGAHEAGHRTSSGERFDPSAMTAAHPSLPLGTRVTVTNAENGRAVTVVINDREPPHGDRIIDLSHAAAAQIGMVGAGRAYVQIAPARAGDPVEVADAPDDIEGMQPLDDQELATPRHRIVRHLAVSRSPRGPRRTHPARR